MPRGGRGISPSPEARTPSPSAENFAPLSTPYVPEAAGGVFFAAINLPALSQIQANQCVSVKNFENEYEFIKFTKKKNKNLSLGLGGQ